MNLKQNHFKVNWANGMKINKDHFIDLQNSLIQDIQLTSHAHITPYNYGLLSNYGEKALNLSVTKDNQGKAKLQIIQCKALLPNGLVITIDENYEALQVSYPDIHSDSVQISENQYYLMLQVNPYVQVPIGDASPDEDPPRQPYTLSQLSLSFVPVKSNNESFLGSNYLSLGKVIIKSENDIQLDDNYIPPSKVMGAHPLLTERFATILNLNGQIEQSIVTILQKINQRDQSNELSILAHYMVNQLMPVINQANTQYSLLGLQNSPLRIIESLSVIARTMKNAIDSRAGSGRENFLHYISEMCNVRIDILLQTLEEIINYTYNHNEIANGMSKAIGFITLADNIFNKLSSLEYIGKRIDGSVFVNEYRVTDKSNSTKKEETTNKKRPNFLAD